MPVDCKNIYISIGYVYILQRKPMLHYSINLDVQTDMQQVLYVKNVKLATKYSWIYGC